DGERRARDNLREVRIDPPATRGVFPRRSPRHIDRFQQHEPFGPEDARGARCEGVARYVPRMRQRPGPRLVFAREREAVENADPTPPPPLRGDLPLQGGGQKRRRPLRDLLNWRGQKRRLRCDISLTRGGGFLSSPLEGEVDGASPPGGG